MLKPKLKNNQSLIEFITFNKIALDQVNIYISNEIFQELKDKCSQNGSVKTKNLFSFPTKNKTYELYCFKFLEKNKEVEIVLVSKGLGIFSKKVTFKILNVRSEKIKFDSSLKDKIFTPLIYIDRDKQQQTEETK